MISIETVDIDVNQDFYGKLVARVKAEQVRTREPLCCHTTFRIGGPADYFVVARRQEEAAAVLELCQKEGMPYFLIGNGSNLLVSDRGFRGLVLKLAEDMRQVCFWEEGGLLRARAGAGMPLSVFAKEAARHGAAGFEFAAGIPGSIGGAVYMNAGAYGGEIKDCLERVLLLGAKGELIWKPAGELELGYRSSGLQKKDCYVLEAEFSFPKGSADEASEKIAKLMQLRKEKQPLEYPSAGSTFKRPEGHFAGRLIMDAGLAGQRVGGAQVSEKHCGFVVNTGNATAADVMQLIARVQETVLEKYGVLLEPEVRLLGEFEAVRKNA